MKWFKLILRKVVNKMTKDLFIGKVFFELNWIAWYIVYLIKINNIKSKKVQVYLLRWSPPWRKSARRGLRLRRCQVVRIFEFDLVRLILKLNIDIILFKIEFYLIYNQNHQNPSIIHVWTWIFKWFWLIWPIFSSWHMFSEWSK